MSHSPEAQENRLPVQNMYDMEHEHRSAIFQVNVLMKGYIFNVFLAQTMLFLQTQSTPNRRITQLLLNRLVVGHSPETRETEQFPAPRQPEQ